MSLLQQNRRQAVSLGKDGNALVLLISFNVIVYILLSFTKIVYLLNNSSVAVFESQVLSYLSVPAQPQFFATRPWTLLVYMFSHHKFWDILSNMFWLWALGYIFQQIAGNKKLIPLYLYGGLAGSVFFLLTVNLVPALRTNSIAIQPLVGAGPSLMALAVATTTLAPNYRVLDKINIPSWVVTAVFFVVNIATVEKGGYGHIAALLAGGLIGYVFIWQLEKGNDWSQWMVDLVEWTDDLFRPEKKRIKNPPKNQLFYKSNQKPFERTPHVTQQRIDDLLDKIHQKGYNSLTEEEKEFLKKASRQDF